MVIDYLGINVVLKHNENRLLVIKNSGISGFMSHGSKGKTILGPRERNVGPL